MVKIKMCPPKVDKYKHVDSQIKKTQSKRVSKKKKEVFKKQIPELQIPISVPGLITQAQASTVSDPVEEKYQKAYEIEGKLGVGGFGVVFAAIRRADNLEVAVKEVPLGRIKSWTTDPITGTRLPTEVALLQICQPAVGVIQLIEYLQTKSHAIIIMERMPNYEDLFDYIAAEKHKCIQPYKARIIVNQIVNTLSQCQDLGVIHRDLKQENVLVNRVTGKVKLIDFGLGQLISQPNQELGVFNGTGVFKPPEYITKRKSFADSLTVWSVGCFAYSLLFGDVPFLTEVEIVNGCFDESQLSTLPRDCRDFIVRCLHPNPEDRPLLKNLVNHPWLKELVQSQMYHKQPLQVPNATYEVVRISESVSRPIMCGNKSNVENEESRDPRIYMRLRKAI